MSDKVGVLKRGRTTFRPLAEAKDPDDPDARRFIQISLATLEGDEDGKYSRSGNKKIDNLSAEIARLLRQLDGFILTDEADGRIGNEYTSERQMIWGQLIDKIRSTVFGLGRAYEYEADGSGVDRLQMRNADGELVEAGSTGDDAPPDYVVTVEEGGRGRPGYDAELGMRPDGSSATAEYKLVDDPDTTDVDESQTVLTLTERELLYVLSGPLYPTSGGKPNDAGARGEIQDVLDALQNGASLEDALDDGIFEGFRAETGRTAYEDENYDGYADVDTSEDPEDRERDVDSRKSGGAIYGEVTNSVNVRIGTTDFTRFGVLWGAGDAASPAANHFAYSPLPQTQYSGTGAPGYPAIGGEKASAKYTGSTILKSGTTAYTGDMEIAVTWDPDQIHDSKLTATLSALETIDNGDPFTMKYILVDADTGTRFLKNGRTTFEDYSGQYDDGPAAVSVAGDAEAVDSPDLEKDPRNAFAAAVEFDVAEIIFHREITVGTHGENHLLSFGTYQSDASGFMLTDDGAFMWVEAGNTIDIVWEDKSFGRTDIPESNARIQGEFLGQGLDGPLAAMGLLSFVAPMGVLAAEPVTDEDGNPVGGTRGRATFTGIDEAAFSPKMLFNQDEDQPTNILGLIDLDSNGDVELDNNDLPTLVNRTAVTIEDVAGGVIRERVITKTLTAQKGYLVTTKVTVTDQGSGHANTNTPNGVTDITYGTTIWGAFGVEP